MADGQEGRKKQSGRPSPSQKIKKPKIIVYKGEQEGPAKRFTTLKEIPLNFKKGGRVKKKSSGKAIRGKGCEIR